MKRSILIIFLFFHSLNISAQYPDWVYLSKVPYIEVIAEEADYIWVGSQAGVLRIDKVTGTRVIFDKTNSPLPDSWISSIVVDNNGNKWFGSWDKGFIIKFDNNNWTIYDTSGTSLNGSSIKSMAMDNNNNLWITTTYLYGGLIKFDGTNWTNYTTSNSAIPTDNCGLLCSKGNEIWFTGSGGFLVKYDGTTWTTYNTSNSNISTKAIEKIDKDNNGNIWLLHSDGVEKFDGTTFTLFDNSNTNIMNRNNHSMTIDNNNIIWTGCSNDSYSALGGLMSFDGISWTKYDTTNSAIPVNSTWPVFADNSNNIWFGYGNNTGLVGKKSGALFTSYNASNSTLINSNIRQIVSDLHGNTYIGSNESFDFGLVKYNWNPTSLPYYSQETLGIVVDYVGNLYLKNRSGLKKFDGTYWYSIANTPFLSTNYSSSLILNNFISDSSGGIWMDYCAWVTSVYDSTSFTYFYIQHEGLAHYDGNSWTTYSNLNSPLPDAPINDIEIDNNNNTWIATSQGLLKFDGVNWTIYNTTNSLLPTNYISSFTIDSLNNIWFSNGNFGLYKFDLTNLTNHPHPTLNLYSSDGVLTKDIDGSIWQYTLGNLIHFDGTNWTTFSADNSPLPNFSNVRALSIDKYGNKWVGTQFGVLIYNENGVVLPTESLREEDSYILIYPNPFTSQTTISFSEFQTSTNIKIIDILGKVLKEIDFAGEQLVIDRTELNNGIYFVQTADENENIVTKKIVVQ
ncbi:MAG: T9SS type A sorting domain-containing protein [Bacteroidia bacterium]